MKHYLNIFFYCVIFSALFAVSAAAQTAEQLLAQVVQTHPQLQAERMLLAQQQARADEAFADYLPDIAIEGGAGKRWTESRGSVVSAFDTNESLNVRDAEVTLSQPIFRGGRTIAATAEQRMLVRKQKAMILHREQELLSQAIAAMEDLRVARQTVDLRRQHVEALTQHARSADVRFRVGDAAKTDVAQAQSRLAGAQAALVAAQTDVVVRATQFAEIFGTTPPDVLPNLSLSPLPQMMLTDDAQQLTELRALAVNDHPRILAQAYQVQAADEFINQEFGARLPTVSIEADHGRRWNQSTDGAESDESTIQARVRIPLYEGGALLAKQRQAVFAASSEQLNLRQLRAEVYRDVEQAWQRMRAADAQLQATQVEVEAAMIALEGVEREYEVGTRSLIELLDRQQEALQAQLNLTQQQASRVIAHSDLRASVGRLTARQLALPQ